MNENELTAKELAARYVARQNGRARGADERDPLWIWEEWITDNPERSWPVFEEIVALQHDDEILQQVGYSLGILLHRHYDAFHERAEELVRRTPRFGRIVGEGFFDEERYRERPLDVEALIAADRAMHHAHHDAHAIEGLVKKDPDAALPLVVEIIHRGPVHGLGSFETFDVLRDLLMAHGEAVIDRVESIARQSYLVRRAIWRIEPEQRNAPPYRIPEPLWQRLVAANAGTTDYTDDVEPVPVPQALDAEDERRIEAWFTYEENFWSFEAMSQLVSEEPEQAWPILLRMLAEADEGHVGSLAAGPLENLLHAYGPLFIDRIAAEARTNAKLRDALTGVYLWNSEVFPRYLEEMRELGLPAIDPR
ncbi:MAG TPA: hypothetical protein VN605_04905 [Thermoanaerobaculia bacterium]|nr:hypothetical protein [Thermoanaerobaculia bacterium]